MSDDQLLKVFPAWCAGSALGATVVFTAEALIYWKQERDWRKYVELRRLKKESE